jgi:hypothetical protein
MGEACNAHWGGLRNAYRETNAKKSSQEVADGRESRLWRLRETLLWKLSQEIEDERETVI